MYCHRVPMQRWPLGAHGEHDSALTVSSAVFVCESLDSFCWPWGLRWYEGMRVNVHGLVEKQGLAQVRR